MTLPRRHTSAISRQVEIVLVVLRVPQRRGLGVDVALLLADVGVLQDVEPLGVRGHEPVLDAVVHHLDEVAGAGRTAVQIALLGGAGLARPSGGARRGVAAGRQRREDRVEPLDRFGLAADHQAVAALEPPHAAAGADVDVVQALRLRAASRAGCRRGSTSCRRRSRCRRARGPARAGRARRRRSPPAPSARPRAACASLATRSSSDVAPTAPSFTSACTASGWTS